jgi:arylsulfatase A-like enzyme
MRRMRVANELRPRSSHWPVGGALPALLLAGLDNLLVVLAYDLAFASDLERAAAWVFWTAVQGVVTAALASLLGAALVGSLATARRVLQTMPETHPSESGLAATLILATTYAAYGLNSFLLEGARKELVLVDLLVLTIAAAAITALLLYRARRGLATPAVPKPSPAGRPLAIVVTGCAVLVFLGASLLARGRDAHAPRNPAALPDLETRADRLNLVLIVVDTMRADRLSYLGYPRLTTPSLDRLAARGIVFRNTWASGTRTSPAMASLLTGLSPLHHGIVESRSVLPSSLPTLAEAFAQLGYRNAAFVSNPNLGRAFGFTRGFHDVEESAIPQAEPMVDAARRWIARAEQPFFLWLHVIDPHTPYTPPPPYDRMFCNDSLHRAQRATLLKIGSARGGIPIWARIPTPNTLADYVCAYDGEIRYADHNLGRLLSELEQPPFRERTATIVTADHGEGLGEHGLYFTHGLTAYDETARVPLVVSAPRLAPSVAEGPARHVDVPATALDVAAGAATRFGEGVSLLARNAAPDREVVTIAGLPHYRTLAIGDGAFKLILRPRTWRDADHLAQLKLRNWPGPYAGTRLRQRAYARELYDLRADPGELRNLAHQGLPEEERLLDALLRRIDAAPVNEVQPVGPVDLNQEQIEQLKALGYL